MNNEMFWLKILRNNIQLAIVLMLFCGVGSWSAAEATEQHWQPLVEKLPQYSHDPRTYQAIQLNNGMKVLLVSDLQAPSSMTAVGLPVGSLQDPDSYPGLAHYLEHLLFLGSKNYPEGLEVQHNAGAGGNGTIFRAATDHSGLAITLKRLADALAHPNFDPSLVEKVRHSVHQEAIEHRTEDYWRLHQINKETLNPRHPFSRFSVGNLHTLADRKKGSLRKVVQDFHRRYYSADSMVAVIYGNQPLADLAHLAAESYGAIPSCKRVISPITAPLATPKQQGLIIHYVPAKIYEAIEVDFVITNDYQEALHSKSNYYLGWLITGEGPGTLKDWLQQQGLADSLSVSYDADLAGNAGLFRIHIMPTEVGMKQQDLIFAGLFRYLQLVKQQGIQRYYFEDIAQQLKKVPTNEPELGNLNYIACLAERLLHYPVEQVLTLGSLADCYPPSYLQQRLSQMVPKKARIWVASPEAPYDKEAYFVKAPYQISKLSQQQLLKWQQLGQPLTFNLPQFNSYTDFTLMPVNCWPNKPELVWTAPGGRAWLKPSRYFQEQPRANIALILRNPPAMSGVRNDLLSQILVELLTTYRGQSFYRTDDAGTYVQAERDRDGLFVSAEGFDQKLLHKLEKRVAHYQQGVFTQSQLNQVKHALIRYLDRRNQEYAHWQAARPIKCLQNLGGDIEAQMRSQIAAVTLQEMEAYRKRFFEQATLDILAVGNLSKAQLRQFAQVLHKQLAIKPQKHLSNPTITIDRPEKALLNQTVMTDGHALAALYIPSGYDRLSSKANARLLSMLLEPWVYEQWTLDEKFGGSISVHEEMVGGRAGLQFTVRSASLSPEALYASCQEFYQQAWRHLQSLKEKREFSNCRRNLLKQLQAEPTSLERETGTWVPDWYNERFNFVSNAQLIARVKALTADEVLRFYQQAVLEPTGLAVLSQVRGAAEKQSDTKEVNFAAPKGWKLYPSPTALQQQLTKPAAAPSAVAD